MAYADALRFALNFDAQLAAAAGSCS